tara:strand:+ start:177 stop:470 length:294 start_codon:yes stop_codon:yes gene_type:complete
MKRNEFDLIAEQYGKVLTEGYENEEGGFDEDVDKGNIYEKLQAFMEYHPQTVEYLSSLLNEFEAIMTDISALEAPDQKIDVADLGIHLNRLAPFSNM